MRRLGFCAIALMCLSAAPSFAGGRASCDIDAGYVLARNTDGRAVCVLQQRAPGAPGKLRQLLVGEARDGRRGFFCRYPHRPSDTVFSGGAGYLIKDDVRRRQGCL